MRIEGVERSQPAPDFVRRVAMGIARMIPVEIDGTLSSKQVHLKPNDRDGIDHVGHDASATGVALAEKRDSV